MTDVGCTKGKKINVWLFFLELCTDLALTMKTLHVCETGRKATKVGGWLHDQSLP